MPPSPNTEIRPLSFQVDPDTQLLSIGGVTIESLAKTYGTPLYILDEETIRTVIHCYKDSFSRYPQPVKILYAAKANLCLGICALIQQEGMGLDVVSGGEYYTALQAGFKPEEILFNGNNKTPQELDLVISHGIGWISVDNFHELSLIHDIAERKGKRVPVLLRATPGIECHTHNYIKTGHLDSKFGFDLSELSLAIDRIMGDYGSTIELTGLHAHIGSQIFEISPYRDLVEVMLNLLYNIRAYYGITLKYLNLGGGLGVTYSNSDDPPNVSDYADAIINRLVEYAAKIDLPLPAIILEPGRSIIATAGTTLYTVGNIKTIPDIDKTYVAVDGGMGDNIRTALYGAVYSAVVVNKYDQPHVKPVTVAGKYCESGDIVIKDFLAPENIDSGDLFLVFGTGAYNYSMSSNYNRVPRPAMILVNGGESNVLVQRETYEDMIARDLIPEPLLPIKDAITP